MQKKAQGATEYLIITAIILIIAVGAAALAGISLQTSGSTTTRVTNLEALSGDLALVKIAIGPNSSTFIFANRARVPIKLERLKVAKKGYDSGSLSTIIIPGEQTTITTTSLTTESRKKFTYDLVVDYTKESETIEEITEVITLQGTGYE